MRVWKAHDSKVLSLAFSPNGRLIATVAAYSQFVWLWDATTGELVRKFQRTFPAQAVAFSPDGKHIAATQSEPNVAVWEVETGQLVAILELEVGGMKSLAFAPDGSSLVVGRRWWHEPTRPATALRPPDVVNRRGGDLVGFTPSGRLVLARDSVVTVAPAEGRPALTFDAPGDRATVNGFAFTRDESKLAVVYQSTTAAVFNVNEPAAEPALLKGHRGKRIRATGFAADGNTVITVGGDGTSRFWATTGAQLKVFEWNLGALVTAAFSPDGLTCAAGGENGQVVVWDVDV